MTKCLVFVDGEFDHKDVDLREYIRPFAPGGLARIIHPNDKPGYAEDNEFFQWLDRVVEAGVFVPIIADVPSGDPSPRYHEVVKSSKPDFSDPRFKSFDVDMNRFWNSKKSSFSRVSISYETGICGARCDAAVNYWCDDDECNEPGCYPSHPAQTRFLEVGTVSSLWFKMVNGARFPMKSTFQIYPKNSAKVLIFEHMKRLVLDINL